MIGLLASGFSKLADSTKDVKAKAAAKAVAFGLSAFGSALGKAERTKEEVEATVHEHALELRLTEAEPCITREHLGPGPGDYIAMLQTVRVAWVDDGRRTMFTVLGADHAGSKSVRELRKALGRFYLGLQRPEAVCLTATTDSAARGMPFVSGPGRADVVMRSGHERQTVRALLDQDPFEAGGPNAGLSAERFQPRLPGIIVPEAGGLERLYSVTLSSEDLDAHTTSTVTTDSTSKGLLSFAGVGPDETKRCSYAVVVSQPSRRPSRSAAQRAAAPLQPEQTRRDAVA